MRHRKLLPALLLALVTACGDRITPPVEPGTSRNVGTSAGADASSACSPVTTVPLLSGRKGTVVGSIRVANDENTLFVTFSLDGGWHLENTQVFVGGSAAAIPVSPSGNAIPGHFQYKHEHGDAVASYTYAVPLSTPGSAGPVVVAAHADIVMGDRHDGAWAGGAPVSVQGSWAAYFTYEVSDCAPDDQLETIACPDIALAANAGLPLAEVAVGELPAELVSNAYALVSWAGGTETTVAYVSVASDGSGSLLVPLHPTGNPAGGEVSLRFTDGALACPPLTFMIDPLPAAPGEFGRVVAALSAIIQQQAALLGATPAELLTDPASLPDFLMPLAVSKSIIDDPANPNSLAALAGGSLDPDAAALLDALLGRIGLLSAFEAQLAPAAAASSARALQALDVIPCSNIGSAAELDQCMRAANSAKFKENGATAKALGDLGAAFGYVGLIPTGPTKLAGAVAGVLIWLRQISLEGTARILPSRFVSFTFEYVPEFLEDEEGTGEWKNAMAAATSEGWKMDKAVVDAVFQYIGVRGGGFGDFLERADFEAGAFDTDIANFVLTQVAQALINTTAGSAFVEVPPKVSGPVNVSDPAWSDRTLVGTSVEMTTHREYAPRMVGTSFLTVGTIDPTGGEFGFQQIKAEPVPIDVKPLQLVISPNDVNAEANEVLSFKVTVVNSAHPEMVDIDPAVPLDGSATIQHTAEFEHTVTYTAPSQPAIGDVDLLTVMHTAQTGARAGAEPRTAIATIRFGGGITISPRSGCVEAGDTRQFTAEVVGLDDPSVEWHVDLGDISESGLYTAPASLPPEGAVAIITATSVEDPEISDAVTIRLGCKCSFVVSVGGGGSTVVGQAGDTAFFQAVPLFLDPAGSLLDISFRDAESGHFTVIRPPQNTSAPGNYIATADGNLGIVPGYLAYFTTVQPPSSITLTIDEYTPETRLTGSASGSVTLDDGQAHEPGYVPPVVPFDAEFDIPIPEDFFKTTTGVRWWCVIE